MTAQLMLAAAASALLLGPPNIKIDVVPNPSSAAVKGAVFMITGRHHVTPDQVVISGRAEGIVDGKRVTQPLTLTPAGSAGVYGVTRQWAAGQAWVLVFTVSTKVHDPDGVAEAVVRVAADGRVMGIDYPMGTISGGYPWPRRVAPREIDAALAALAAKNE